MPDELKYLGLAQMKSEGERIPYDGSAPAHPFDSLDEDTIKLATGRELYANRGIVGIDAEGNAFEGYDSGLSDAPLTLDERREIAEMMIERWRKYGGIDGQDVR